ncbi:MAG: tRNA dihydrouridine synthase DusB [Candidatus Melainabacteria bacterium RIFOXYA12_FULL_32_12]|nr:MAG: tRNA dihydrouridine synthase DusB [Candidatus Melainabacteria bacterium RIFOXYA2_FULL_32_9]OGI31099.1 MAG: tRNA dihydrouridine synthase DusB [Candidatus Melainabacteria bacterium RIFOXYA12_FULL_32_12]
MNTKQYQELNKAQLTIGTVQLNSKVILAPMAGITDSVLRQIVRMFSSDCLLTSEMVSSEALLMNHDKSIINHNKIEYPLSFQLSGHKPELMAKAAKALEEISTIIDINMGCPAPKIVRNNDGVKLMTDLKLASQIISSIKNSVSIPVTVKFRLGWDSGTKNFIEFAKMAEESGADALCIHGRTKSQMYSGIADWHALGEAKNSVKIPVIANGDITSPEKAKSCLEISKCDGIAIGRGILGDPGLIYRIEEYIQNDNLLPEPTIQERLELALIHCKKEAELKGEIHGIKFMRKFFGHYIKGIRNATKYRFDLVRVTSIAEIEDLFSTIIENLDNSC